MTTYFLADPHFFHASPDKPDGIIRLCNRPFSSGREMLEVMSELWRATVRNPSSDDVIVLGDFANRAEPEPLQKLFDSLPGRKHLIRGNHDTEESGTLKLGWDSIRDLAFTTVESTKLVLCHYALRTWPGIRKSSTLHLYGHSHGRLPGNSQSMDIGVDVMGFAPVRLSAIKQRLAQLPPLVDPEVGGDDLENDGVTP